MNRMVRRGIRVGSTATVRMATGLQPSESRAPAPPPRPWYSVAFKSQVGTKLPWTTRWPGVWVIGGFAESSADAPPAKRIRSNAARPPRTGRIICPYFSGRSGRRLLIYPHPMNQPQARRQYDHQGLRRLDLGQLPESQMGPR